MMISPVADSESSPRGIYCLVFFFQKKNDFFQKNLNNILGRGAMATSGVLDLDMFVHHDEPEENVSKRVDALTASLERLAKQQQQILTLLQQQQQLQQSRRHSQSQFQRSRPQSQQQPILGEVQQQEEIARQSPSQSQEDQAFDDLLN